MKKSLIALAVLAASGAAMAQSSVTISGNVNMGIVKQNTLSSSLPGATEVTQKARLDAANGASQIVFSGVEDLGGGLKATFRLAQRFSPESGGNDGSTNGRPTWQGESTVGLAGNFGAIKLGRQLTALQGPVGATDPWGTWTVGSTHVLVTDYATDPADPRNGAGLGRTDAITYASPVFSGFSGAVSVGLKSSAASGAVVTQAKNLGSIWLSYANGPIMVGGGHEQNRRGDKVSAILGTYDFGVAKLGAGYSQVDNLGTPGDKGKNWNLMASAPIGAFTLKAGYSSAEAENSDIKTKKVGIGGEYALSKRTYLYTTYGRSKKDGTEAVKGFDIGMNHAF